MSDFFAPIPLEQLLNITLNELRKGQFLGIPESLFFKPQENDRFKQLRFNQPLATPIGVAAGPHTQLAQNIIMAWLCGARYIELKTVQTLDELEISKPCIDMQDEGYNCEWSQELKLQASYDEYLNAWIIIHILAHYFKMESHGTIFNMSVGYNLAGIKNENVQKFFANMKNCKKEKDIKIDQIRKIYPRIKEISIPDTISDNITLSTMHGCPAGEIEEIAQYLLEEKNLHTTIKLNPTLLGPEKLRYILNDVCNFKTEVPDIAFEHDLKYSDAKALISRLHEKARNLKLFFGLKLTNTLESENNKEIFEKENTMMYMSGRALHPISIHVAEMLQKDFGGTLNISFSAGADALNIVDLISCGLNPVTVCSDILKPGGYGRLAQYIEILREEFEKSALESCDSLIFKHAKNEKNISKAIVQNVSNYAEKVLKNPAYKRTGIKDISIKTKRPLNEFDCISAPCTDTCPTNQNIPAYIHLASKGEYEKAFEVILETNPFPGVTGMVCDHECQTKCTRINYDNSLRIRDIKRFITDKNPEIQVRPSEWKINKKIAVIGAGPSGLSCAYYLSRAGFDVKVYEEKNKAGGMTGFAIPAFRLDEKALEKDIERIAKSGVEIKYNALIDKEKFDLIRSEFDYVYLAVGAKKARQIGLLNGTADGIYDPLEFLESVRNGTHGFIANRVAVIGGGNTAMDIARTAKRLIPQSGSVNVLYRRAMTDMPADPEEISALIEEGIEVREFVDIKEIKTINNSLYSLVLYKMKQGEKDSSGRRRPVAIEGSEFEEQFDALIPAVGQDLDIFIDDLNLLKTNAGSYETAIENVFIGGDAKNGAATIIKAVADGRRAAQEIISKSGFSDVLKSNNANLGKESVKTILQKKAVRKFGVPVRELDVDDRHHFNIVQFAMNESEIREEASRCLLCDEICNICTTVCPNGANYGFSGEPIKIKGQKIAIGASNNYEIQDDIMFEIKQEHQIINIGNWCNECGNCATFCPTSGAPYKTKPKFYLTKESFDEEDSGYYIEKCEKNEKIFMKNKNDLFELSKSGNELNYNSNKFSITIDNEYYTIKNFTINDTQKGEISTIPAIKMAYFLKNVAHLYPNQEA